MGKFLKHMFFTILAVALGIFLADLLLVYEADDKGVRVPGSMGFIPHNRPILTILAFAVVSWVFLALADKVGLLD